LIKKDDDGSYEAFEFADIQDGARYRCRGRRGWRSPCRLLLSCT
jgi:hypothetical protein